MIDPKSMLKRIELLSLTSLDNSWKEDLFNMGIWKRFEPIYDENNFRKSNIIVSFISFSFSCFSNMVHLHKDRIENKREILFEIGADKNEIEAGYWDYILFNKSLLEEIDLISSEKEDPFLDGFISCINWYLNWQKDSDWKSWVDSKEFVSTNMTYATSPPSEYTEIATKMGSTTIKTPDNIISGTAVRKSQLLTKCLEIDSKANILGSKLKVKYTNIDTIIEQEKYATNVDLNPMRFEDRLRMTKNKIRN